MNIIAVIVYNRLENIRHWINCWQQCEQDGTQLYIIHTGPEHLKDWHGIPNVHYISRPNIGYDIGAFQDVCKERLNDFPNDWERMLWITDDTFPMAKDFYRPFFEALDKPNIGCACMQVSNSVRRHIRTTGFAIKKELSRKIKFLVDPITTKEDCYQFEHRHESAIFYNQVVEMGLEVVQVAPDESSPLWDTGYTKRLERKEGHDLVFERSKPVVDAPHKVAIICPAFNKYPVIIASMIAQSYTNWELLLIHDGPNNTGMKELCTDPRIKFIETPQRLGKWGHYIRQEYLNKVDGEFVVITNADNYHTENYLEAMVKGFEDKTVVATYCSQMAHSYIGHKIINCRMHRGYVDCAGVMVRAYVAAKIGWNDVDSHSSDWTYFEDIMKVYGEHSFRRVEGCLLVHN